MSDDELAEFQDMWDGSEDWGLYRHSYSRLALAIQFEGDFPTIREIIALRKLLVKYRNMPPAALRDLIGSTNSFELGIYPGIEGHRLLEHGQALGLRLIAHDASYVSYLPVNRTDSTALMIEDDILAQRVTAKMLASGVPVVGEIEVD